MRVEDPLAQGTDPFAALADLSPDLATSMFAFGKMPYEKSRLSLREFEAARIRTAEINGCLICQGFRAARDLPDLLGAVPQARQPELLGRGPAPDEAFYRDILDWRTSAAYDERERAAIEMAERMGMDPGPLPHDTAFWSKARSVFSEAEIADLVISIAAWIAGGRVLHVLGLDTVCAAPATVAP